jgi:hypothetical protein
MEPWDWTVGRSGDFVVAGQKEPDDWLVGRSEKTLGLGSGHVRGNLGIGRQTGQPLY